MKKILILLLLVPSLSWGDLLLIKTINNIYTNYLNQNLTIDDRLFHTNELSNSLNIVEEIGLPCYREMVSKGQSIYFDMKGKCVLFRGLLGLTDTEWGENIYKIRFVLSSNRDFLITAMSGDIQINKYDNEKLTEDASIITKQINILLKVLTYED